MTGQRVTQIGFLILVLMTVAYDIFAYKVWGVDATISRVTLAWAREWPVVPFSVGVVVGHLFWPQRPHLDGKK